MDQKLFDMIKAVLGAFVVGTLFVFFPIIGIIGLVALAVVFHGREVFQTGVKLTLALFVSFVWVVFAQIFFGWTFGISLETAIKEYGAFNGLAKIFSSSGQASLVIFQEMLILTIALGSLYLFLTSRNKRPMIYTTVTCAFLVLIYQAVDNYVPLSPETSEKQKYALTEARNVFSQWLSVKVNRWNKAKTNEIGLESQLSDLPLRRFVAEDKIMYLEDGKTRTLKPGEMLLIDLQKTKMSDDGMLKLYFAVLYDDSKDGNIASGYISLYNLAEDEAGVPSSAESRALNASTRAMRFAGPMYDHLFPDTKRDIDKAKDQTVPKKSDATNSKIKEDVVTAKQGEWTDSEVIPYPGDVIEFGPFDKADDVKRLLSRTGGEQIVDLVPVDLWNGRFIGRVTCQGGPNTLNAPCRVKLETGPDLVVKIRKVNTF